VVRNSSNRGSFAGRGKTFLLSQSYKEFVDPPQPQIQCVTWVKRPGHKADHSFPFGVKVENEWSHTSMHLYAWRAQGQMHFCCNSDFSSSLSKSLGKWIPIRKSHLEILT